jgi:hypothetical protein
VRKGIKGPRDKRTKELGPAILRPLGLFVLLSFGALSARAHDIYTSFAEAKLLPDKLEITLTLARSSAHNFLPEPRTSPPITPETFPDYAPQLRALAPQFFQITSGAKPLALAAPADVKISGDADVVFTLTYPRPPPGPLKFFGYYLGYLVDGHVATFVVANGAGDDLGWSPLSIDQPTFHVVVPASNAAPKKPKK